MVFGADRDGQRVGSRLGDEASGLLRVGKDHRPVVAAEQADLSLHRCREGVRDLRYLAGLGDILVQREAGAVEHHRSVALPQTPQRHLQVLSVVEVQDHGHASLLRQSTQQRSERITAVAPGPQDTSAK